MRVGSRAAAHKVGASDVQRERGVRKRATKLERGAAWPVDRAAPSRAAQPACAVVRLLVSI
eukprot:2272466-Prymnesium_polylepis.1